MGVLVWSPLCRGWLTGRYRRESFDRSPQLRAVRGAERADWLAALYDESRPQVQRKLDLVEELSRVAGQAGISMTLMAIAFTRARPRPLGSSVRPSEYGPTKQNLHESKETHGYAPNRRTNTRGSHRERCPFRSGSLLAA
jgi:aryl-alcohol dehydrogenase-like predicted oxidoreductase